MSDKVKMKRVNVIIPESYHSEIAKRGLKLSGVVREALEDQLNPDTITLSVTKEIHDLYMQLFSMSECNDADFAPYLKKALKEYVEDVINKRDTELHRIKEKLEAS
jgi:hypothetical protein